jgi:hypothetical protein
VAWRLKVRRLVIHHSAHTSNRFASSLGILCISRLWDEALCTTVEMAFPITFEFALKHCCSCLLCQKSDVDEKMPTGKLSRRIQCLLKIKKYSIKLSKRTQLSRPKLSNAPTRLQVDL